MTYLFFSSNVIFRDRFIFRQGFCKSAAVVLPSTTTDIVRPRLHSLPKLMPGDVQTRRNLASFPLTPKKGMVARHQGPGQ